MSYCLHVAIQLCVFTVAAWELLRTERRINHAALVLVAVYVLSNIVCLLCYTRPPARRDLEEGCLGCVPSVGHLHRLRLRFFVFLGTMCMLIFVFCRHNRVASIVASSAMLTCTLLALHHCHAWYAYLVYLFLAVPVACLFTAESIANKQNIIAHYTMSLSNLATYIKQESVT